MPTSSGTPAATCPKRCWPWWTAASTGIIPACWRSSKRIAGNTPEVIALTGAPLLLPGGEAVKNDPLHVTILHQAIQAAGLCRHSYVAAIGGGALIDTVGFAAATAHRGVRLLRVPTTVLSQADAAIGVKNSVNAMGQKNFLGVFAPPAAVLNDFDFLTTLSQKDWIGGVAEAVKVALIKDADFFAFLESRAEALAQRDLRAMRAGHSTLRRPAPGAHRHRRRPL